MSEQRADGIREVRSLFQARGSGAVPTSALQLIFAHIPMVEAKRLNQLWHSRLPKFSRPTCRASYGAEFDGVYYATAILTNPLARMLPQREWIELNRMAIAPDAPKNTASRMLSWLTRDVKKRFPEALRLVSYQAIDCHAGTIYKASGWRPAERSSGGEWNSKSKSRTASVLPCPKQRWDKCLVCAMGPERNQMCEVCRERFPETDDDATEPTGTEAGLPLPERAAG